ncbi:T-box transcription factor TBX15-like [Ixodes scapularis]
MEVTYSNSATYQGWAEERQPLRRLQPEQLVQDLSETWSMPFANKRQKVCDCDSCCLRMSPQSASLPQQEARYPGRYPPPTVAYQDFSAFAPSTSSCGASSSCGSNSSCVASTPRFDATRSWDPTGSSDTTSSWTLPVQTSSSLQDGSPVQRSELAHQASLSLRDWSLSSTYEQSAEVLATHHDFLPDPFDNLHSGLVPVYIEQREGGPLEKYCADVTVRTSSLLEAQKRTEQSRCPQAEAFWTRICSVSLNMTIDSVSDIVANENTNSEEFQSCIAVLSSDIDCDASTSVTTVGDRLTEVLVSQFFSLRLGDVDVPTEPKS